MTSKALVFLSKARMASSRLAIRTPLMRSTRECPRTAKFAFTEAGGAGYDVNGLEVQGQMLYPNVDVYVVAGGRNQPYDYKLPATVTNNQLSFVIRRVGGHHAFVSALQIAPVTGTSTGPPATPLTLTATPH